MSKDRENIPRANMLMGSMRSQWATPLSQQWQTL